MLQFFHNPRCGKSRNGLALLQATAKNYELVSYLTTPPTEAELRSLLNKLNITPLALVRQKEKIWVENYKGKTLTDNEIIQAMLAHPILIERPIIATDKEAIIAREEDKINAFLSKI